MKKYFISSVAIFFLVWGTISFFMGGDYSVFDKFFCAGIALLALYLRKRMNMTWPVLWIGAGALLLHNLGLYGTTFLGVPFDRYMHFYGGFALAVIFSQYLHKEKPLKAYILSVGIAIGIASLIEILEFVGYTFLGRGEGLLFYGTGDFGEWSNTCWDLISNTAGALAGAAIFSKKKWKWVILAIIAVLAVWLVVESNNIENKILEDSGINMQQYLEDLRTLDTQDEFAEGDRLLVLGRVTGSQRTVCQSVEHYKRFIGKSPDTELKALAHETIASIGCGEDYGQHLEDAALLWDSLGMVKRADLDRKLAAGQSPKFYLDPYEIKNISKTAGNWIGNTTLVLEAGDLLVTQADRVTRDWLSAQIQSPHSQDLLRVFSEKYFLEDVYEEVGWHEGARVSEIRSQGIRHYVATGNIAKKFGDKWYAADENGIFRFEILPDKIDYPTTRFLRDDIAVMIDTHGISTLVEEAIRLNATAVLGCCDAPGKVQAADYLASKGIKVICPTDRFLPELLYSPNSANVIGSAPIDAENGKVIIGNRPLKLDDKIVAMSVPDYSQYAIQYYDTPSRFFDDAGIATIKVNITDFGQMAKVINMAEDTGSHMIAVRVYNEDDYANVKAWLEESKDNKAILFHSIAYPYGYMLFRDYPGQTSFQDLGVMS